MGTSSEARWRRAVDSANRLARVYPKVQTDRQETNPRPKLP
jgi:hypothetical protein